MKVTNLLLLCLLALTACGTYVAPPNPVTPRPTPVLTPVMGTMPITAESTQRLHKLAALGDGPGEPVAALAFTPDGQELLAVHSPSGHLLRWRVADGQLLKTLEVGPVGVVAASFDGAGRLLVTAAGDVTPAVEAGLAADFKGFRLFDTQMGERLLASYSPSQLFGGLVLADVTLSTDGKWIGETSRGGFSISDRRTGDLLRGVTIMGVTQTVAEFDPTGEWLAHSNDRGAVGFSRWDTPDADTGISMGTGGTPLALAIDPTRRYIAALSTESLVMRRLSSFFGDSLFGPGLIDEAVPAGPAAGLAFSPDGSLLAVGTQANWQLWSVAERRLLHQEETGAYAVAFSPDGRLLAIGGTDGTVHLWGVPNQE
jgi:WD40 repeat protein